MIEKWKLDRCRDLKAEADRYRERMREIQPSISSKMSGGPRGSQIGRPTEESAVNLLSLEELMRQVIEEHNQLAGEICHACLKLDSIQRQVIILRYIEGRSWEDIARHIHYSTSWVMEQHKIAVNLICKSL